MSSSPDSTDRPPKYNRSQLVEGKISISRNFLYKDVQDNYHKKAVVIVVVAYLRDSLARNTLVAAIAQ